jgi:hypothetical protein
MTPPCKAGIGNPAPILQQEPADANSAGECHPGTPSEPIAYRAIRQAVREAARKCLEKWGDPNQFFQRLLDKILFVLGTGKVIVPKYTIAASDRINPFL